MSIRWMSEAFCRHFPTMPWIAEPSGRTPACETAMAVVCRVCPVLDDCWEYAQRPDVTSGFWAGEDRTPNESRDRSGAA